MNGSFQHRPNWPQQAGSNRRSGDPAYRGRRLCARWRRSRGRARPRLRNDRWERRAERRHSCPGRKRCRACRPLARKSCQRDQKQCGRGHSGLPYNGPATARRRVPIRNRGFSRQVKTQGKSQKPRARQGVASGQGGGSQGRRRLHRRRCRRLRSGRDGC